MVLADVGTGQLRLYDEAGRPVREVSRPGRGRLEFNRPARVAALPSGFLVQEPDVKLLWLDEGLVPVRSVDLSDSATVAGERVGALFAWQPVSVDSIFAFGQTVSEGGTWWNGFFRIDGLERESETTIERIDEVPLGAAEAELFTFGYPYVAIAGKQPYFLRMNGAARIVEGTADRRRLDAFPERLRKVPVLPPIEGVASVPVVMKGLERARIAAGLYGRGDQLYVLGREPAAEGVRWTVSRIDPARDAVVRTVTLPTRAPHLVVVPGPDRWAIVEKGAVRAMGDQEVPSLLLVPTPWIEEAGGPLAASSDGGAKADPCETASDRRDG